MNQSTSDLLIIPRKSGKASPRSTDFDRQPRASSESNSSRQNAGQSRPAPREPTHQYINAGQSRPAPREPTHQYINSSRREAPISDLRRGEPRGPPLQRDFEHEMGPPRSNQQASERSWQSGGSVISSNRIDLESRRRSEGSTRRPEASQKSAEFEKYAQKDPETRFELIAG